MPESESLKTSGVCESWHKRYYGKKILFCVLCAALALLAGFSYLHNPKAREVYSIPAAPIAYSLLFFGALLAVFAAVFFYLRQSPELGRLARSLKEQSEEKDWQALFLKADKDLASGRRFGPLYVGAEWVIGAEAIRFRHIKAVSRYRAAWPDRAGLCITDDRENAHRIPFQNGEELESAYAYIGGLLNRGQAESYSAPYLPEKELEGAMVYQEKKGVRGQDLTWIEIYQMLMELPAGDWAALKPVKPFETAFGLSTALAVERLQGEGAKLFAFYQKGGETVKRQCKTDFPSALRALEGYLSRRFIPDFDKLEKMQERGHSLILRIGQAVYEDVRFQQVKRALQDLDAGKCEYFLLSRPGKSHFSVTHSKQSDEAYSVGFLQDEPERIFKTTALERGIVLKWLSEYYYTASHPDLSSWHDVTEIVRETKIPG